MYPTEVGQLRRFNMSVSVKMFPRFLEYALSKKIFSVEDDNNTSSRNNSNLSCKIFLGLNSTTFELLNVMTDANMETFISNLEDQEDPGKKNVLLRVTYEGNFLKFSLNDVIWLETLYGDSSKALVYFVGADQKHFVMWFDFGVTISAYDVPFKLKMNPDGELKINFNPS